MTSNIGRSCAPQLLLASALFTLAAAAHAAGTGPARLTPAEISWPAVAAAQQAGSSMQSGVESLVVYGDAGKPALYSIMFRVQPHGAIPAHSHPDDRSCFVVTGVWYFGYGDKYDAAQLKALPAGSHYTEPSNVNHFAGTREQPAVVECTSVGPAGTAFVDRRDAPRH